MLHIGTSKDVRRLLSVGYAKGTIRAHKEWHIPNITKILGTLLFAKNDTIKFLSKSRCPIAGRRWMLSGDSVEISWVDADYQDFHSFPLWIFTIFTKEIFTFQNNRTEPTAGQNWTEQRRHGKKRNSLKIEHQGKSQTEPIPRNLQIKNIILFFYI